MTIKQGYKLTDIGIIPQEWEVKEFQDVMTGFSSGATPYRGISEYYKGEIKWITSGELNYNVISDTIEKITEEAVRKTNLKVLPKGTFLIAITGLEAEGTRGSCGFVGSEATTNQSCMALFPKPDLLDNNYLFHYYVWQGNNLAFKYCQGTKQQSYTGRIAKILPIIIPPSVSEQKAIAQALSDTDALITALESLIDKKRLIKQGTMQQLLTGKRRLEGFSGEWEVKKLGEISVLMTNGFVGVVKTQYTDSDDGVIYIQGFNVEENSFNFNGIKKINLDFHNQHLKSSLKEGDLLTIQTGDVGLTTCVPKYLEGSNCHALIITRLKKHEYFPKFFSYYLNSAEGRARLKEIEIGTTMKHINVSELKNFEILVPPSVSEQKAVAAILSDMDTEIAQLEAKRDKYKQVKQGMMQELLTGRIRLV